MHRPIRSYVLRAGRVTEAQRRALQTQQAMLVPYAAALPDWGAVFAGMPATAPLILEIGSGMGEATAQLAAAQPHCRFVAVEVHEAGVGALLNRIEAMQLHNLRLIRHDAVEVLRHMLAPASLDGVHVFFPDPWHKLRHHKRRLIQPEFVQQLALHVKPGGYLHLATDWVPYADHMQAVLNASPSWRPDPTLCTRLAQARPKTKFEQRGQRLQHEVRDLVYVRV